MKSTEIVVHSLVFENEWDWFRIEYNGVTPVLHY